MLAGNLKRNPRSLLIRKSSHNLNTLLAHSGNTRSWHCHRNSPSSIIIRAVPFIHCQLVLQRSLFVPTNIDRDAIGTEQWVRLMSVTPTARRSESTRLFFVIPAILGTIHSQQASSIQTGLDDVRCQEQYSGHTTYHKTSSARPSGTMTDLAPCLLKSNPNPRARSSTTSSESLAST